MARIYPTIQGNHVLEVTPQDDLLTLVYAALDELEQGKHSRYEKELAGTINNYIDGLLGMEKQLKSTPAVEQEEQKKQEEKMRPSSMTLQYVVNEKADKVEQTQPCRPQVAGLLQQLTKGVWDCNSELYETLEALDSGISRLNGQHIPFIRGDDALNTGDIGDLEAAVNVLRARVKTLDTAMKTLHGVGIV